MLLFYLGCFALFAAQVIQSCSSHHASACYFYFVNVRRKQGEYFFYPYTARDFPDSKGLAIGIDVLALNDSALKLLNSFFVTFFDLHMYVDGVPCLKGREGLPAFVVGSLYALDALVHSAKG